MAKNIPNDLELYKRVLAEAKRKFDVYPSFYANSWVVAEYKRRGGTYRVEKAKFGSSSEAGRYAANIRWQRVGAISTGSQTGTVGPVKVSIGGREYEIDLGTSVVSSINDASQYPIKSPSGRDGMLQVFPDGSARVIGIPSMRVSSVKLAEALQGKVPGAGPISGAEYGGQIKARINSISRTASTGEIDTTGSAGKEGIGQGMSAEAKMQISATNTNNAIDLAMKMRSTPYGKVTPSDILKLMDEVNLAVNKGITPPGMLMRTGDSTKFPYTKVAELPQAKQKFAEELASLLNDPTADPVRTSAMIHWKMNFVDHYYADGVGRSTEIMAAIPMMRAGLPLPKPSNRSEWFSHAAKETGMNGFDQFADYYRSLT